MLATGLTTRYNPPPMTRRAAQTILYLLPVAMLLTGGCMPTQPCVSAWVANEMVTLTDRTKPFDDRLIYEPGAGQVRLFAVGNETVSFQLVVDGGRLPGGTGDSAQAGRPGCGVF